MCKLGSDPDCFEAKETAGSLLDSGVCFVQRLGMCRERGGACSTRHVGPEGATRTSHYVKP